MRTILRSVSSALAVTAPLLWSCSDQSPASGPLPIPAEQRVVFTQDHMVMHELGTSVAPPLTTGSARGRDVLASTAPDVVQIDAGGKLVALRDGFATIRGRGALRDLQIEVRSVHALSVVPEQLRLSPGASAQVTVFSENGPVPQEEIEWIMDNPFIASIDDGRVRAGKVVGLAELTAVHGGTRASIRVEVTPANLIP